MVWDGGAGTNRWQDGANWAPDGEPGRKNEAIDDFVCIPSTLDGQPVEVSLGDGVESHLVGIDAEGTLTVADGGKLFLHGPAPSTLTRFDLSAGTLGGEGTVTVTEVFNWTSQPRIEGASTQTTRALEAIPPEDPDAPPTDTPGRTVVAAGAALNVNGPFGHPYDPAGPDGAFGCGEGAPCGGVNLRDGRVIENHGVTSISEAGYIAADWGTTFENFGELIISNDRGYYEGFLVGGDSPSAFVDSGTIRKSATSDADGPGRTSVIDAVYTTPNASAGRRSHAPSAPSIQVEAGTLSVPTELGIKRSAVVSRGGSFQTGACLHGEQQCSEPAPSAADLQTTSVSMPSRSQPSRVDILEQRSTRKRRNFKVIGEQVTFASPNASATAVDPLHVTLTIDDSQATHPSRVFVFRGKHKLASCTKQDLVDPAPACIASRTPTAEGDVRVVIASSSRGMTVYPARRRNF